MDTPKANYRYLITEDNEQTIRLMRFICNPDGTPLVENGCYTLALGERVVKADNVQLTASGYRMMMSTEVWHDDDTLAHVFKVLKVIDNSGWMRLPTNPSEPSVYYTPDDSA